MGFVFIGSAILRFLAEESGKQDSLGKTNRLAHTSYGEYRLPNQLFYATCEHADQL